MQYANSSASPLPVGEPEAVVTDALSCCGGGYNRILNCSVVVSSGKISQSAKSLAWVKVDSNVERSFEGADRSQGSSHIICLCSKNPSADFVDDIGSCLTINYSVNSSLEALDTQVVT